jgi:hypothetical protein
LITLQSISGMDPRNDWLNLADAYGHTDL